MVGKVEKDRGGQKRSEGASELMTSKGERDTVARGMAGHGNGRMTRTSLSRKIRAEESVDDGASDGQGRASSLVQAAELSSTAQYICSTVQ